MDSATLKDFKQRLKDFEQRLTEKEKDHEIFLENAPGLDDLGLAREKLEDIMRRLPEDHEHMKWETDKENLDKDLASLLILISQ